LETRAPFPENNFIGGGVELLSKIPVNNQPKKKPGKPSFSFFKPTISSVTSSSITLNTQERIESVTIKDSVRTPPPPEVYRDGFIVGNIPSANGETLVRNDDSVVIDDKATTYENTPRVSGSNVSNETPKRPDFSSWEWMDTDKKQQLADMEIQIPEEEEEPNLENYDEHDHEHNGEHNHNVGNVEVHDTHHEDHGNHHDHDNPDHHDPEHGEHVHHGPEHMDHHGEHGHGHHEDHSSEHMSHHGDHGHGHHGHHPPHFEGQVSAIFNPLPEDYLGLESSSQHLSRSEKSFVDINNELGFKIYKSLLDKEEYQTKNLIFSPLSTSTMLAMVFLGARGTTSWQMNALLKLDEMISFNPHLMYKNVTDTLMENQNDFTIACMKQLWVDEVNLSLSLKPIIMERTF